MPKAVCAKHHVAYEVEQGCLDCVPPAPEYIETDEPLMFSASGSYYGIEICVNPEGEQEYLW